MYQAGTLNEPLLAGFHFEPELERAFRSVTRSRAIGLAERGESLLAPLLRCRDHVIPQHSRLCPPSFPQRRCYRPFVGHKRHWTALPNPSSVGASAETGSGIWLRRPVQV